MPAANEPDGLNRQLIAAIWKEGLVNVPGVQDAFQRVPRHLFLPHVPLEKAYADQAVPLKYDRNGRMVSSCSQPTMMAVMLDQLRLKAGDNVLEIGTASGYNAAIMQRIVGLQGYVTSIELDRDLADQAIKNLARARVPDVRVVHADGAFGYLPRAAYDHIIATVGVWDVPPVWIRQLKENGSLVVPLWVDGMQVSACFRRQPDGSLLSSDNRSCAFVTMRGEEASPNFTCAVGSSGLMLTSDTAPALDTARLHTLLSNDHDLVNIEPRLNARDYSSGLQMYLALNAPSAAHFFVYSVGDTMNAYGLSGRGVGLVMPGSAVFASYEEVGAVHVYGGSEAFENLQALISQWAAAGRPSIKTLRLHLMPHDDHISVPTRGKRFRRRHHDLHLWYEL